MPYISFDKCSGVSNVWPTGRIMYSARTRGGQLAHELMFAMRCSSVEVT